MCLKGWRTEIHRKYNNDPRGNATMKGTVLEMSHSLCGLNYRLGRALEMIGEPEDRRRRLVDP